MKIIPFYFLILAMILTSCNKSNEITIGFLMESYSSARWATDKKIFEERIAELNGKVIVKTSDGNESTQYIQAMELIEQGVDVLVVVASNVNTAASIVREAHKKNIKVIAYDRIILNCELDYFVGFDNVHTGKLQAMYALNHKPKGNYVIICGDKGDMNARYIETGQMEELKPKIENGDIEILYRVFVDGWSPDEAKNELERVIKLSDKNIDAVLCANDGTASGAIEALEKFGLGDQVIITGLDAELAACKRILQGKQSMTVYTPIKNLAGTAASLAMDLATHKSLNYEFSTKNNGRGEVKSIILKPLTIDKSNMESIIVNEGIYKKEEIYTD
jgi:D-xylose transport system substrate-binding protein